MAFKSAIVNAKKEYEKKKKEEEEELKNKLVYKTADSVVPIRNKDADNSNFVGGLLGGLLPGSSIADAAIKNIRADQTLQQEAKKQGIDLNNLYTTQENLNMFGADLGRTIEATGAGISSTLSNLGKGALLAGRDLGGASDFTDKITNEMRNKSDAELEDIAKKNNISTTTLKDYINKSKTSYENINDFSANTFDKWANEANQRVQELQAETDNPFTKEVIGFMPNLSQQAVNVGVSFINPALVPYVAGLEAKGSYYNDAKQRGMTDEQANDFSTAMAGVEAFTEKLTVKDVKAGITKIGEVKSLLKGGIKGATKEATQEAVKETTKSGIKEAFKSLAKGMGENAFQEGVTEIIQEAFADAITKKDLGQSFYDFLNQQDNWEDIWGRVFKSAVGGALSAGITGGVGMGVSSCVSVNNKIQNGEQVTQQEILQANQDAIEKSKTLPKEQQEQFNEQITQGSEIGIQNVINQVETEQNQPQNEPNRAVPMQTSENAQQQVQEQKQQVISNQNENALNQNVEPQNLVESAERSGIDVKDENTRKNLEVIQKFNEKRGVKATFDADAFKGHNNVNSFFRTDENGNREIVFNPNTMTDKTIQQLAVHEVYHDMVAGGTAQELTNFVIQKMSNNPEYQEYVRALQDVYEEQDSDIIKEEAVAHYLEKNLGTDEFISELQQRGDRTTIQRIIDTIKDMITKAKNTLTGKGDLNYLLDLQRKYEQAYRGEFKGSQEQTKLSKQVNDNISYPENVKDIKNLNDFIRKAKENETDNYWSSQLDEASKANYTDWTRKESRLEWKRNLIQQYLDYKNNDSKIRYSKETSNIKEYNNIDDVPSFDKSSYNHRPKPRKGWDIDRIQKELKNERSDRASVKEMRKFDSIDELMNNIFYHGSISSHDHLKAGSTLSEEQRTGGYGEAYHSISLSKSKNIASNFASMGSDGTVTPVLLKKDANVISMPQIEDSIELEDILPELWNKNVDAVKIGDWDVENKGYGEQEIVILNPNAIATMGHDTTYFKNFGKPKFQNMTSEEISNSFNKYVDRAISWQENHIEELKNREPDPNGFIYKTQEEIDRAISNSEKAIQEYQTLYNKFAKNQDTTRYSQEAPTKDNQGRTLTKEQQDYFKDSKARDENGNLKEMYHGTPTGGFNIFDNQQEQRDVGFLGKGFYFTSDIEDAGEYSKNWDTYDYTDKSEVKKVYLDMKNPYVIPTDVTYSSDMLAKRLGVKPEQIQSYLKENGYDGIIYDHPVHNEYVVFEPNQIKNVDNTNPTENADIRYDTQGKGTSQEIINNFLENTKVNEGTGTAIKDLARVQEETTEPVRQVAPSEAPAQVPQVNEVKQRQVEPIRDITDVERPQVPQNQKVRKTYESIINSNQMTQEAKQIAKELMGYDTYVPQTNEFTLAVADRNIKQNGVDESLTSLTNKINNNDRVNAVDIATGERLIEYYSKIGDREKLQEAIQTTAMAGTEAGRAVQAMSMISHQTPIGQVTWIQRSVDKVNKRLAKEGKKAQFNFTPEMQQKILNSTSENLQQNLNEVYQELGKQVPKSNMEKFNEWRYFSMLANPKTHIRNILGNTVMKAVQNMKNKVAGTIEDFVIGDNAERWNSLKGASKGMYEFAKNDLKNADVQSMLGLNENKYNPQSRLQQNQRTFKSDLLENTLGKLFNLNSKALEVEDGWGLKSGYAKAMTNYLNANNLDYNNLTDAQLQKARNYAVQQAKEATFHQENTVANVLQTWENKNLFTKVALGGAIPFKKTPMNVALTGFEYSPAGFAKTLTTDLVNLRKGKISANQFIDNISKNLTGTAISLLGYGLTQAGILKASGSGDEDKDEFEEATGKQNYSIQIGDKTYSLDWLTPAGIPLFIGSELYQVSHQQEDGNKTKNENEAFKSVTKILDATASAMNPMSEMTMISGLTNALKSYAQGSTKSIENMLANVGKSYVTQTVPTALGQIARSTDQYERSTTSTETDPMAKAIDSAKNQIISKIPGLRETLPVSTDVWGNARETQSYEENAILPWTNKEISKDPVNKALTDLYDATGESSVLPDNYIDKSLTIDKEKYKLTNEEYARLKQQYGKTAHDILSDLTKSKEYEQMSDEQKVKAVKEAYSYAKSTLKVTYSDENNLDAEESSTYKKVQSVIDNGGDAKEYFEYTGLIDGVKKEKEKRQILLNSNLKDKGAIYESTIGSDDETYQIMKATGIDPDAYLDYKQQDFSSDKEDDGTVKGKTVSGSGKTKFYDYMDNADMTYEQKLLLTGMKYKLLPGERDTLANYIDTLPISASEKTDIYKKLKGATVYQNGEIYY